MVIANTTPLLDLHPTLHNNPTSVELYDVTGDGTTDDRFNINTAIAAVGAAGGGTLFFPPGTYMVGQSLVSAYSNVHLRGAGVGATTIKATNGFVHVAGAVRPVIEFHADSRNVENVSVSDMTIDGNRDGRTNATEYCPGVQFRTEGANTFQRARAERLHIKNTSGDCLTVRFDGHASGNQPEDVSITDCVFEDPVPTTGGYLARQGLAVIGGRHVMIAGNSFRDMPAAAIDLEPNSGDGNTISGVAIVGNTVENADEAVFVTSQSTCPIEDVVVAGNSLTATTTGIRVRANGADVSISVGQNAINAATTIDLSEISGSITWMNQGIRALIHGYLQLGAEGGRDSYATSSAVPELHYANSTYASESSMAGALVLQSRSSAARPILFVTGSTPAERMRVSDSAVTIENALDHDGTTVGFYGVAPTVRQTLATGAGATADNIITALQTLGLVKQS